MRDFEKISFEQTSSQIEVVWDLNIILDFVIKLELQMLIIITIKIMKGIYG